MYKWIAVAVCALLLVGAGCQKKTIAQHPKVAQPSRATEEQLTQKAGEIGGGAAGASDNLVGARIRELAPEYGYTFSEANTSIVGPGTAADGIKMPEIVIVVKAKLPDSETGVAQEQIDKAVREVLQGMVEVSGSAAATDGVRPDPAIPQTVVGTWRTVREEQGATVTVQHDDKYYEQLSITENKRIGMNIIRDGELFAQSEFGYSYDSKTGKLTLLGETGNPQGALFITFYPDHPELIYVQEEGNEVQKVYQNIGGASASKPGKGAGEGGPSPSAPDQGSK